MDPSYRQEPAVVVGASDVISVTMVMDTSQLADDDVAAIPQEVTNVARLPGGKVILQSLVLLDEDDQGVDLDIIFLNATGSLGNLNAACAPTDAVARTIVGVVNVLASATPNQYTDLNTSQIAVKNGLGLMMECAADSTSLWVGIAVRSGTPTYTASGVKLKLGFLRD